MSPSKRILLVETAVVLMPAILLASQLALPSLAQQDGVDTGQIMMAAALAIAATGFGAGIGMGIASAAAVGAVAEKPEIFGRTILYVVFIEAIAIYGLVISFTIITRAP